MQENFGANKKGETAGGRSALHLLGPESARQDQAESILGGYL
jgi:hypothetical protein